MEIFKILRNRRTLLKVTQQDLADITGISPRTIVNIEQGKGNPSFATLQKIAAALGLEITAVVKKII
ncbi:MULTISPECIES: helix-turn-helix domain-containing protein [Sanguibacteroides]|uniref:Transcriptional regulator n=1 Tax=Sanguibacteroides justesenii TaxID=1547597 RepID=A0A0C3NI89_9PORP|nr:MULTISPECIES: helix-turn-helix transcriptional regulator [Sanguibacteroides]KIO43668.1 transcriptional regulator [Sanguibacteroides justesenii]KIO45832.1 transcriptional regulator [Sanguibacteroides justesenii]PXZ45080.1 XRE family transcriptional regulator [Sanguibacteroides justesenii]